MPQSALNAALRIARAEQATLAPVFLARVPLHLPLDTPLPRQCCIAVALLDAIDERAARYGVPTDGRIERGRDRRHALRETISHQAFYRAVVAAACQGGDGFDVRDVAWLLDHMPGEVLVLRPASDAAIHAGVVEGLPAGGMAEACETTSLECGRTRPALSGSTGSRRG